MSEEKQKKSGAPKTVRNVCFTLNNWTDDDYMKIREWKCVKYGIIGQEVGESGNIHLQGYLEFRSSKQWSTLLRFNKRIHWEARKAKNPQDAADYCKKGDQSHEEWKKHGVNGPNFGLNAMVDEWGEISKQGERSDLKIIVDNIIEGKECVDDIVKIDPKAYHEYGRTLEKAEDIKNREKVRDFKTKGVWYFGETGCGKSHKAFEGFSTKTHYIWKTEDNGWQDGYNGQEIVIIDDFRGEVKYNQLLQMTDKWPSYHCRRRGKEPMPFTSKLVIITSCMPPEEMYRNENSRDGIKQLTRRVTIYKMERKNDDDEPTIIEYKPKEFKEEDTLNL